MAKKQKMDAASRAVLGAPRGAEWKQETNPGVRCKVTVVPLKARPMQTVEWDVNEGWDVPDGSAFDGAFVRIRPPANATDDDVHQVRAAVVLAGALAIRTLPRPRATPETKASREAPRQRETHRQACQALVATVATQDRPALEREVEAVMVKVGL